MNYLKSIWLKVIAGLVVMLALFRFKDKFDTLEASNKLSKTKDEDRELEATKQVNAARIEDAKKLLDEKQKEAENSDHKEVEDFYKDKLKK